MRKRLPPELSGLMILAMLSLCAGIGINAFREEPVPWIYVDKAGRMDDAAAKLAETESVEGGRNLINARAGEAVDAREVLPENLTLEEFRSAKE